MKINGADPISILMTEEKIVIEERRADGRIQTIVNKHRVFVSTTTASFQYCLTEEITLYYFSYAIFMPVVSQLLRRGI